MAWAVHALKEVRTFCKTRDLQIVHKFWEEEEKKEAGLKKKNRLWH